MKLVATWTLRALAALGSGATLLAQEADGSPSRADLARSQAILRDRNRVAMHPGEPLAVVGQEQAGNDLRSITPALLWSDRQATLVDPDEDYDRKLAMLEGRAIYHRPPQPAGSVGPHPEHARSPRPLARRVDGTLAGTAGTAWPWIASSLLAIASLALWLRKRPALARNRAR